MTERRPTGGQADATNEDESILRKNRRAEREAEALRENLRRRKQQARARNIPPEPGNAEPK